MNIKIQKKGLILLVVLSISLVQLACVGSGILPDDWILQPPLVVIVKATLNLLEQFRGIPGGGNMAPWITEPNDFSFMSESPILIKGWVIDEGKSSLVLYEVEPNANLTKPEKIIQKVGMPTISNDTKEWQIEVELQKDDQFFAARLERSEDEVSPFSNIVYISKNQPAALKISSPKPDEVIKGDQVTLEGTGQPGIGLVLSINDEKTDLNTIIDREGNWRITDVPLIVQGFDKNRANHDVNRNKLSIESKATDQIAVVNIRKIEPIHLTWPYGTGDPKPIGHKDYYPDELYKPDITQGTVSSFFNNDWHYFSYSTSTLKQRKSNHYAMDIYTGRHEKIHAVSSGVVVGAGKEKYGNYLIIDSGGWGVLYLHIMEHPDNPENKFPPKVKIGDKIVEGQIIATEGNTYNYNIHLHIAVCVFPPNADRSSISNFYDKNNAININPPSYVKNYSSYKNMDPDDKYGLWGGSNFCHDEGCWKFKWGEDYPELALNKTGRKISNEYAEGCWKYYQRSVDTSKNKTEQLSQIEVINDFFRSFTRRAIYCLEDKSRCPCP